MGQYYKPVNLDSKQWLDSHKFGSGLKLMEHSYIGNGFVEGVEVLMTKFGPWYKDRLIWAGDYADPEFGSKENLYELCKEEDETTPYQVDKIKEDNKIDLKKYRYVVNHTLKEYVDKNKMVAFNIDKNNPKDEGWKIHPLSLLTAEGNGLGGGDYGDNNPDINLVGKWARHSISIEEEVPKDYKELKVKFRE